MYIVHTKYMLLNGMYSVCASDESLMICDHASDGHVYNFLRNSDYGTVGR